MPRWISPLPVVIVALLSGAGYAAVRYGWIPVEFGHAPTGAIVEPGVPDHDLGPAPEFEADDSEPLDINGVALSRPARQTEPVEVEVTLDSPPTPRRSALRGPRLEDLESDTQDEQIELAVAPKSSRRSAGQLRLIADEQTAATPQTPAATTDLPAPEAEAESDPPVRVAKRSKEQESGFNFAEIDLQIKGGKIVEAHQALSKLYWQQPDLRSSVQERIDLTAKALYFSPQPHLQEPYVVQPGDQLRKIASKYHVSWQYLARLNRTDPKRLREGQKLKVINGPFGAVVTLRDFELTLHLGGQYVRSYPCCIGKNNSTPTGKFKVLNKVTNPQYTDPDGKVFSGTDPKNPLGSHWLDLGDSYGIHGTIEPDSIGKAESRGCVRMLNADVNEVYDLLEAGAEVIIRQ